MLFFKKKTVTEEKPAEGTEPAWDVNGTAIPSDNSTFTSLMAQLSSLAFDACYDYKGEAETLSACGLDGDFYAHRERPRDEVFPWCRIDPMVTPAFLWREREQCYSSQTTPDCRTRCSGCGANRLLKGGVCNG